MGLRPHVPFWQTTRFRVDLAHPVVMGIVNVTPDSFSDGGRYPSRHAALDHAQRLLKDGAHILDIGGESSRPGALTLSEEEEWLRIRPVLSECLRWDVPISLDTYKPVTMRRALDLGVDIINDIGGMRQPEAVTAVAAAGCGVCVMHMHGEPQTMQAQPMTGEVVKAVADFLQERTQALMAAGVAASRIALDPGVGFGKTAAQNFSLLARQSELQSQDHPWLVGWSRKSSLGEVTGLDVTQRLLPSVVAAVLAVERGAQIVRVHDVAETVTALAVWQAARPI
jgi:dihydropteroate synthase